MSITQRRALLPFFGFILSACGYVFLEDSPKPHDAGANLAQDRGASRVDARATREDVRGHIDMGFGFDVSPRVDGTLGMDGPYVDSGRADADGDGGPVDLGMRDLDLPDSARDGGASSLVERGLVVRYFLGEDALGDARRSSGPADFPLEPAGVATVDVEDLPSGRGVRFQEVETDDGYCSADAEVLRAALNGSRTASIEVVALVEASSAFWSRLLGTDRGSAWNFTIATRDDDRGTAEPDPVLQFAMNDQIDAMGVWAIPYRRRSVLTLVLDSSEADPQERLRLFVDGTRAGPNRQTQYADGSDRLPRDTPIAIDGAASMCVGNRAIGGRSPRGAIYYGAYYNVALRDEEVAQNALRLLADDDR